MVACSYFCSGFAYGQTLEHAVKLMLHNEPELQAANFDRLGAIEDWKAVRGDLLPRVSVDGAGGYVQRDRSVDGLTRSSGEGLFSRQIGISLRQLLYDGGVVRQQTLSAELAAEAQEFIEGGMMEARVVDLCETYLEILRAKEQVREAKIWVGRYKEIRDKIEARAEANSNRADLALVDGRLSLAVDSMENQQEVYENALIRFTRLTGQTAAGIVAPDIPKIPAKELELDLTQNWDILASVEMQKAVSHKFKGAKADRGPKVYFDTGASAGEDVLGVEGADNEVRALIAMSWDLYDGGSKNALQQREYWQLRKAEQLIRAAREESVYKRSLLWKEREGSRSSVRLLGQYAERLESVVSDYQEQFKVGRQRLLSILDVEEEHYTARRRLLDARYNADTTAYRIVGVQGLLTRSLIGEEEMKAYLSRNPESVGVPERHRLGGGDAPGKESVNSNGKGFSDSSSNYSAGKEKKAYKRDSIVKRFIQKLHR